MGRVPARIDLTDEEINEYVENSLAKPFEFDGLTVEDFKTAWFDSSRKALSEKIIGDGDAAISQAIIEECQDVYKRQSAHAPKTFQNSAKKQIAPKRQRFAPNGQSIALSIDESFDLL